MNLIFEAILVSISTLIFGIGITKILKYLKKDSLITMLIILGFSLHLFFEFIGLNKVYCKYGNACKL